MKVIVVGGVAAGMSFAARARRLNEDAQIIVLERGEYVSFANCGLPYFVGGEITDPDRLLVQTPQKLRNALNLDVRVRHEVTAVDTQAQTVTIQTPSDPTTETYDVLFLAPGAEAMRLPIPGIDSDRVLTLRTVDDARQMRAQVEAGINRAVVLGAGFIGLEAAEALAQTGVDVTVVEMADHVLPPLEVEVAHPVQDELGRLGIKTHLGVAASAIRPGAHSDTVVLADGTELQADLICLSAGVVPATAPFAAAGIETVRGAIVVDERGRTSAPNVYAAGDAVASTDQITGEVRPVALAGPANRAGRLIADFVMRGEAARPLPRPLGTAIVRVGRLTAAMTGANRAALERNHIAHTTLHLHPNQHAGYFPGASQISLVVHIGEDGRLLGAQAVGEEGVDKRTDVLATAIRAQLHVEDLIDLDLSYSPPYGQAKDAVNLIGMVGANVLDGTLRLWYPAQYEEVAQNSLILDTRSRAEYETGYLPGSLNIPHTELRDRLDEVRGAASGRPVRVLCASGVRSATAHRLLTQSGFDSASLSGGITSLRQYLGKRADTVIKV